MKHNQLMVAFKNEYNVLLALVLRDIKTRFVGNGLGFLLYLGWPLSHIIILLLIYRGAGRIAPLGDNLFVFFAAALVPFMTYNYMARFIMLSIVHNHSLLQFPIVRVLDIIFARAILEALTAMTTVVILCCGLGAMGINFIPQNIGQAALAEASALLMGLALGLPNAVLAMAFRGWILVYTLTMVLAYMASGIIFLPANVPAIILEFLWFNPLLHLVEWMREAYFDGYVSPVLDKRYLAGFILGALFLGLCLERAVRGRVMSR